MTNIQSSRPSSTDYRRNSRLPWTMTPPADRGGNGTVQFTTQDGHYIAELYLKQGTLHAYVQRYRNRRIEDKEVFSGPLTPYHVDAQTKGFLRARLHVLAQQAPATRISELIHLKTLRHSVWCAQGCVYVEWTPEDEQAALDAAQNEAWSVR